MNIENIDWTETTTRKGRVKSCFGDYSLFTGAKDILDWGCSYGHTSRELFRNTSAEIFGIDKRIDPLIFEAINKKYGSRLNLVNGDGFTYFQKLEKQFEIVLGQNNILCTFKNHIELALSFLFELVKDNKLLILASNYADTIRQKNHGGAYIVLRKNRSGFRLESIKDIIPMNNFERDFFDRNEFIQNIQDNLNYFKENY